MNNGMDAFMERDGWVGRLLKVAADVPQYLYATDTDAEPATCRACIKMGPWTIESRMGLPEEAMNLMEEVAWQAVAMVEAGQRAPNDQLALAMVAWDVGIMARPKH